MSNQSMKKITAISGSIKERSVNTYVLEALKQIAADRFQVELYKNIDLLPFFNPDLDKPTSPVMATVADFRAVLKASDVVIISTPEYAHGVPGVLKNALDWIVSSGELVDKPVFTISASPMVTAGQMAHESLRATLKMISARLSDTSRLSIPFINQCFNQDGILIDDELRQKLASLLNQVT